MKICPKCGVSQKDSNRVCVDCGTVLGKPIDEDAAYYIEKERRDKIDGLSYNLDELSMGRFKLPLTVIFSVTAVGSIVTAVLGELDIIPFSEYVWLFLAVIFSVAGLIGVLFPQLSWKLELMRLSWYIDTSEASPSYWYIFTHKLAVWLCLVLTAGCIIGYFYMGDVVRPEPDAWMDGVEVDRYYSSSSGTVYIG